MDDPNPYASPRGYELPEEPRAPLLPPHLDPEPAFAWRDGDTLLMRRKGAVLPKACVKSNRATSLAQYGIATFPNWSGWFVFPLFLIPFVGVMVAGVTAQLLASAGPGATTRLWFRSGVVAALVGWDRVVLLWLLSSNMLTGCALVQGSQAMPGLFMAGCLANALGIVLNLLLFNLLGYLRLELVAPDLIRIRGVHPEYLARLPEFDGGAPDGDREAYRGVEPRRNPPE